MMANDKPSDSKKGSEPGQQPFTGASSATGAPPLLTTAIVMERRDGKKRKKRKYSSGTKPMQEFLFGLSKAGYRTGNSLSKGLGTFVKRSRKSSRKKRDGMMRDSLRNLSLGISDGFATLGKAPWDLARRISTRRAWRTFRILTPGGR